MADQVAVGLPVLSCRFMSYEKTQGSSVSEKTGRMEPWESHNLHVMVGSPPRASVVKIFVPRGSVFAVPVYGEFENLTVPVVAASFEGRVLSCATRPEFLPVPGAGKSSK
jgi:hypothetical protein